MKVDRESETPLFCPSCREVLSSSRRGAFRCATGHAFDGLSLLNEHSKQAEILLAGLRIALESEMTLSARLAALAAESGQSELLRYLRRQFAQARSTLEALLGPGEPRASL